MTDEFIDTYSDELIDVYDPSLAQHVEDERNKEVEASEDDVRKHLRRTMQAYRSVFVAGNASPSDVEFVMKDLAWFCKAYDPLWQTDPRMQDRFVARREVFQRIMEYTRLDHDTLAKMYIETQR